MKIKRFAWLFFSLSLSLALVLGGCVSQSPTPAAQAKGTRNESEPQVTFTLKTMMMDGRMVYIGSGGTVDGMVNPDLVVDEGAAFQIELINGDGMPHDLAVPEIGLQTAMGLGKGQSVTAAGTGATRGEFAYFCTVAGHRQAGMEGKLIVRQGE